MNWSEAIGMYLPVGLWVAASACLIFLMLVVFGYHLYQRSRFRALSGDCASVGELAARKDTLSAEVEEMRNWLATQRPERLKLEAERHQQELARADLAQLRTQVQEKRVERQKLLSQIADIDLLLIKRRQLQARLEGEIRSLEEQREELGPMEKYAQELRLELDKGNIRLGQIAQEEVRTQALQTQAQLLRHEVAELTAALAPLREERTRLRNFIEQARHSVAVKNEQLLEQKRQLRQLEDDTAELGQRRVAAEEASNAARSSKEYALGQLEEMAARLRTEQEQLDNLRQTYQAEQMQLEGIIQRKEERALEVVALESRKAVLERELEAFKLVESKDSGMARKKRKQYLPRARHSRKNPLGGRGRPQQIFCGVRYSQ